MIPLRYKDGGIARGVVQIDEQLGSINDTVLDPLLEVEGGWIELPSDVLDYANRRIDKVFVPPFGAVREGNIIVLSQIQTAAQMLLIMVEKFKIGEAKKKQLQRSLTSYQLAIMRMIFGRSGFISEYLMCNRMQRSGRAVLLPRKGGNPMECSVPAWMCKKIGIKDGALVLIGRDPTIWDGGVEVFRARAKHEDVIRLHPFVFEQLNADCVAQGTPIFLRHKVENHRHMCHNDGMSTTNTIIGKNMALPIEALSPSGEGEVRTVYEYETPDRNGNWVPIKMSMNKGKKNTIDITSRYGGTIRVTPDHKVLSSGVWKRAREISVGNVLDLGTIGSPQVEQEDTQVNSELSWALGLFCADGFARSYVRNLGKQGDTRYEFRLTNNNVELLHRAQKGMAQFGVPMEIQQYKSEAPGAVHRFPTDKHISHLVTKGVKKGQKRDFVLNLVKACYQGKEKKIPNIAMSSPTLAKAWIDGFFAGDGRHKNLQEIPDESAEFTISSRTILMSFPVVAKMAGFDITIRKYKDRNSFSVRLRSDSRSLRKQNKVIEIVESGEHTVYDITTDGEFLAGMNVVHNCDGDQVWVLAIPDHLQKDMQKHLGSFMKRNATWPKPWNFHGKDITWERAEDDLIERSRPDVFSIGPEDILFETKIAMKGQEILNKEVLEECQATAKGLTFKEWQGIILEVNESMLRMKVGMGPIGAGAMNLRILAQEGALSVKSACAMAERLEQLLLDAKRAKDIGGASFSADDALDILNRRNSYSDIEETEATTKLSAMLGLKPSAIRPMVKIIWREGTGLSALVRNAYPMFASTQQAADNRDVAIGLATELFHNKEIDRSGVARFIVDVLKEVSAKRKEARNAEQICT